MLGYLSTDIICSEKWTFFREHSSRKTVNFEEQTMSKDKYPSLFSPQMEAIVFIILQIFLARWIVLKIGEYSGIFPSFSWRIFSHVMCLDQSCASKNIWWIINQYISPIGSCTALADIHNCSLPFPPDYSGMFFFIKTVAVTITWSQSIPRGCNHYVCLMEAWLWLNAWYYCKSLIKWNSYNLYLCQPSFFLLIAVSQIHFTSALIMPCLPWHRDHWSVILDVTSWQGYAVVLC